MKQSKRILSVMIVLLIGLLAAGAAVSVCYADEKNNKTVRVAYEIEKGYQEGREGEYKTGFGYEYLQELSKITGWKYEYVYGTFSELLEKLEKGDVDLMGQLSYSEERAENISYGTYEEGRKNFYLYVRSQNKVIDPQDISSINGKKIGVCAGKIQKSKWEKWCADNNVQSEIVEFDYLEDCEAALNKGEIDGIVEGRIHLDETTDDWEAILKIDAASFYFCVNKNRPDLLEELNNAQNEILEEDPFYNEKVQSRYMNPVSAASAALSDKEKDWLNANGSLIKYGYLEGFPPLFYSDENGTCQGVAADALSDIEKQYAGEGVHFEASVYSDYYAMFDDLKNGTIDIAWPAYNDYWNAEQSGYTVTDPIVETSMMLVYDGQYTDDTVAKIGVINTGSLPKIYGTIYYPESEILEYDSYVSAVEAVLKKEVGSVLYVSTTYNVDILKNDDLQKLNMTILPDSFGISMAVLPENEALNSILDKGIQAFGEAGANHSLIVNTTVNRKITLHDFVKQNSFAANSIIGLLLALIAGSIFFAIYNKMLIRVKTSQAEKETFERLSNSDPLTGLYNRKAVFRKCAELLQEYPDDPFVMTHIDMAHFRLFNTFFGDEAGDKLLCDTADLFREMAKDYDHWAYGRIEADVFCAFFPYNEKTYRKHLTNVMRYLKAYRDDFLIEPKVGIYFVTDPKMPMESMFTRAAMAAKEVRPGTPYATVIYDEKLEKEMNDKQQIINDMQTAVDEEQFKVYLQPKYALRTNKMVGAEALVRWDHPTKGMISPGAFIPVFESNGFITILDRYMWEHVCQLLSKWKKEGRPMIPVSVNVSRLSMFGSTTVDFLKEIVEKYDIDPKYLELELTESAYMDDPEEMKLQMHALKAAGFTILLDDFGSGYSCLNTLREIPVDVLKMDMKFLSLEQTDVRGGLVISSIIRMAKLLNLLVVAEGVETQQQADYLKGVGCEFVQGFLFSRPVPVSDFEKMLVSNSAPLDRVNQPVIEHIGKILAETGSGTYAMGTVIPTPLACLEYADKHFGFLRVNPAFYNEFSICEDYESMSMVFEKHLDEKSSTVLIQAIESSIQDKKEVKVSLLWHDGGKQRRYICSVMYEGSIGASAAMVVTFINVTDVLQTDTAGI